MRCLHDKKTKAAIIDFVNFEKQKYIKSSSTFKSFTGIWAILFGGTTATEYSPAIRLFNFKYFLKKFFQLFIPSICMIIYAFLSQII